MYSVKVEFEKNNLCYGCLSTDREITLIKSHLELFYTLLEHEQIYDSKILLCWECKTSLNKVQAFRDKIQQAQFILEQCGLEDSYENLSTLTTTIKDSYDEIIEYDEETHIQPKVDQIILHDEGDDKEIELFDNVKEKPVTDVHNEKKIKQSKKLQDSRVSNDFDRIIEESSIQKTNINIKKETDDEFSDYRPDDNSTDNDDAERKQVEKQISAIKKKYLDNVKISDSNIDVTDLKQYCCRITMDEREIEDILERDRKEIRPGTRRKRPYKCRDCGNDYKKRVDYLRHATFNHMSRSGNKFKCKYCKKSASSWALLEQHWSQHNMHYMCTICNWATRLSAGVISHIETMHAKIYTCLKCDNELSNFREFKKHYRETHERIICDHCGKSFRKKRSMEIHIRRHHLPPTCEICNRTYARYHNLETHYRLNHPEMIKCENRKELAYCVECNKQFPSVYKYRRHLSNAAIHTPPKVMSIPCPECGKVFSRKIRMTNHVMSVHRKSTKHRCDICNKTFCSAYSAKTHRKCVHEKIPLPKNKLCDICGRGFSTNRILRNHRRTHTGERPYACPHCPATFAQIIAMQTHAKTQHKHIDNTQVKL